ncbi:sterigmatocystin 8-O-methyltransferase [Truncatella angustata]|uniref:Sterigmatocystin 8-O-methyltransferase n=1 Tax=Truncatella angustata TaxID=152316 RepID=A0A9P8ZY20_9PEZI|nr:sterigmatocystin 8-O-methyltransferase [Truncatella angustata]KAH6654693.1 sterigmatocystin 8-O-methyltransferase [Truncatella angustata]
MCPSTPLETYAEKICTAAKQISTWCNENQHPQPSLGPSASSVTLPPNAPVKILTARSQLVEAAFKIQQLAIEPNEYLSRQAVHYQVLASVHWLSHFRIFSFIPLTGSVPRSEVAALAMVPENQLKATARMAMTSNLLCEPSPGELAHTAASRLFVANPAVLDWALFMAKGSAPTASKMVEATEKWGATTSMTETAFNVSNNTTLTFFDYISQTPDMAKLFVSYMKNVTSSEGTKIDHLIHGYDWASLGKATVVDMGGSDCHASVALASAYPDLNFVVQDLPRTIANGPAMLAKQPDSIRTRIICQEHNFFTPQPVMDADAYFLRMIFHDWPDKEALTILRHLVPVLKARPFKRSQPNASNVARIIIMDTVLPDPGTCPTTEEALMRVRDLAMLQAFNGKERELTDWKNLLAAATAQSGEGAGELELLRVHQPFGSLMSLLEVVFTVS